MPNREIIIRIPEEKYDAIKSDLYNTFPAEMKEWGLEAIRNGTPLPKDTEVYEDDEPKDSHRRKVPYQDRNMVE